MNRSFFRDKHGKLILGQKPNIPIIGFAVFMVAGTVFDNEALKNIARCFLFVWAYLEITEGSTPFRRSIGLAVFIMTMLSILML